VEAAGSHRLQRMHNTLLTETRMCLTALEHRYPGHRAIAESLQTGDEQLLGRLLISHMEDAPERLTGAE
jgi:DNA-binding GntR family transcriptional regulator